MQISGTPAAGDRFVIQSNAGGTGDNRNLQALINGLGQPIFGGAGGIQDATASLITSVGTRTAEATNQRDVQQAVLKQGQDRLESVRGVNLDEEAADMLRFQQLYQAAARMMSVADDMFKTILAALGG